MVLTAWHSRAYGRPTGRRYHNLWYPLSDTVYRCGQLDSEGKCACFRICMLCPTEQMTLMWSTSVLPSTFVGDFARPTIHTKKLKKKCFANREYEAGHIPPRTTTHVYFHRDHARYASSCIWKEVVNGAVIMNQNPRRRFESRNSSVKRWLHNTYHLYQRFYSIIFLVQVEHLDATLIAW